MKEIEENEILRFTRAIPVPKKGPWEVALLRHVGEGEMVRFRGESWRVDAVRTGEFCGGIVYQTRLVRSGAGDRDPVQ